MLSKLLLLPLYLPSRRLTQPAVVESVSVFYQIGTEDDQGAVQLHGEGENDNSEEAIEARAQAEAKRAQEHEFRIGCVGVSVSCRAPCLGPFPCFQELTSEGGYNYRLAIRWAFSLHQYSRCHCRQVCAMRKSAQVESYASRSRRHPA